MKISRWLLPALCALAVFSDTSQAQKSSIRLSDKQDETRSLLWMPEKCTDAHYLTAENYASHRARHKAACQKYWDLMTPPIPPPAPVCNATNIGFQTCFNDNFYYECVFENNAPFNRTIAAGAKCCSGKDRIYQVNAGKSCVTSPPSPSPTSQPTSSPTSQPTPYPTAYPTPYPTAYPTPYPTAYPTPSPTAYPTKAPTSSPTIPKVPTKSPTMNPTATPTSSPPTASPTQLVLYGYQLSEFELKITHTSTVLDSDLVKAAIFAILDNKFKEKLQPYYHDTTLNVMPGNVTSTSNGIESSFNFNGHCRFTTANATAIPTQSMLNSFAMNAFLNEGSSGMLRSVTSNTYKSFSLRMTDGSNKVVTGTNNNLNPALTTNADESITSGAMTMTVVASAIAVISTLLALILIIAQRRRIVEEDNPNTPTKAANTDITPKKIRKIRSPFSMTSPVDGTRKYFNKLDDESVSLKGQSTGYLNPNISVVNSSFSKDEESSLEAPSMAGLSSICEYSKTGDSMKSLDGLESADGVESCADMSALDEVRLGRVLNLEESTVGDNSRTTVSESGSKIERRSTFAKLWYGSRRKKNASSPNVSEGNGSNKLAPPKKDSPTKKPRSPLSNNDSELEESEDDSLIGIARNYADDNSLLGNQSDKGSYYNQAGESSNLFLSMLGDRSVNSMESDSIDFNEMYKVDSSSHDEYSSMGGASSMMSSSVIATVAGENGDDAC